MDTLQQFQQWYYSQCDGDWEHQHGVEIGTLDNPGWRVRIDVEETSLSERPFAAVERVEHETDWIVCRVRDGRFEGAGGPLMLEEILEVFLAWARQKE